MCNIAVINWGGGGCSHYNGAGLGFWTAGYSTDPHNGTAFVWRETYSNGSIATDSEMSYTSWMENQPSLFKIHDEACVNLFSGYDYDWNDQPCSTPLCALCEIDL